jgi:hypothetical protein
MELKKSEPLVLKCDSWRLAQDRLGHRIALKKRVPGGVYDEGES